MEKITYIAIVPSPLFSHLVSALELSKRLVHLHPDFHVTCIIPILESPPTAFMANLETLPTNIDAIFLPPVIKDDIPQGAKQAVKIQLTVTKSLPSLHEVLKSLSSRTPLAALVADPFSFEVLDFAKKLDTLAFIYLPSSAMIVSLLFYMPKLDEMISGEYRELSKPIQIPGCVPLHGTDLPDPLQDRSNQAYKQFLQRARSFHFVDGVLVNSLLELEEGPARALTEEGGGNGNPPVYLVGPFTRTGSNSKEEGSECLRWVDKQPPKSVLYISFGVGGTLSQYQINELALGLEQSGKKFLWVLRPPSDSPDVSFRGFVYEDPLQFLPKAFLERTKEQGLVIPSWAPQIPILTHSSTGGFLTNCGWNSILESVQQGVPLIAWPLFAEQKMNAVLLTNGLKVALRPKINENGIVEREEIAKVIKSLMEDDEGREICKRMKCLKDVAANALKDDGSSTKALFKVALKCKIFQRDIGKQMFY